MKYYAVKAGNNPGIYESWSDCEKEVRGFKGAIYKSFSSLEEAQAFLKEEKKNMTFSHGLVAYVDGSFNAKKGVYGYGVVLLEGQKVVKQIYGKGEHSDYVGMRNVAGEIFGSEVAIEYAIDHGYDGIAIYYDYEGIEKWATGLWKANKPGTINYQKNIKAYREKIQILFYKVLAHSGDTYNEMADALAKKAVGIS